MMQGLMARIGQEGLEPEHKADPNEADDAPKNPLVKALGQGGSWQRVQQVVHMNRMVRQLAKAASNQKARMYALRNTQPHTIIQRIKMLSQRAASKEGNRNRENDLDELCLLTSYICEFMRKQPYLVGMELCRAMHYEHMGPDKAVCKQGEYGDKFYIVLSGKVEVLVKSRETGQDDSITVLHRGSSFGDWALLNNEKRTATCITRTPTEMLFIEKDAFCRVFKQTLALMHSESERFLLKEVMMFKDVKFDQVRRFANHMWLTTHPEGKAFPLDTETRFYIIRSGKMEVLVPDTMGLAKKAGYASLVRSPEDQSGGMAEPDTRAVSSGAGGRPRRAKAALAAGNLSKGLYFCGARLLEQYCDLSGLSTYSKQDPLKGWVIKSTTPVELYVVHKTDFAATCGEDLLQRLMEEFSFRLYYYSGRLGMRSRPQSSGSLFAEEMAGDLSARPPFGGGRDEERSGKVSEIIAHVQSLQKGSTSTSASSAGMGMGIGMGMGMGMGAGGGASSGVHLPPAVGVGGGGGSAAAAAAASLREENHRKRVGRNRLTSGLPQMGVVTSTERYWEANTAEAANRAERYWKVFNSERAGRYPTRTKFPELTPKGEDDSLGYASAAFLSGRMSVPLVRQCFTYAEIQEATEKNEQMERRMGGGGGLERLGARSTTPTTGMRGMQGGKDGFSPAPSPIMGSAASMRRISFRSDTKK